MRLPLCFVLFVCVIFSVCYSSVTPPDRAASTVKKQTYKPKPTGRTAADTHHLSFVDFLIAEPKHDMFSIFVGFVLTILLGFLSKSFHPDTNPVTQ
jgi:multidrug efflux pump subunit AcrB